VFILLAVSSTIRQKNQSSLLGFAFVGKNQFSASNERLPGSMAAQPSTTPQLTRVAAATAFSFRSAQSQLIGVKS